MIELYEFAGQPWSKRSKYEKAPNIMAVITRFNHVGVVVDEDVDG